MKTLTYIFGFAALLVWISSVQAKDKKNILLLQALANLFYALYYYLLDYPSTALMNMISVMRCLVFAKSTQLKKQPHVIFLIIFILFIIIDGTLYTKSILDFLPLIATILYTISGWVKSTNTLRYTYIICACIFSYYNYNAGAYIPLIGNIGELISGTISIIRFNKKATHK